jgi:hypothetical protein
MHCKQKQIKTRAQIGYKNAIDLFLRNEHLMASLASGSKISLGGETS